MKRALIFSLALFFIFGLTASAGPVVQRCVWSEVKTAGKVLSGTVVSEDGTPGSSFLRIENPSSEPHVFPLLRIDSPAVSTKWHMAGTVRYRNVEGQSYLELLNYFPQGQFFTRTMAPGGAMGVISGSSEWRPFILPFDASTGGTPGTGLRPQRLELNLILPGKGVVEIGTVELSEGIANSHAWWSDQQGGLIGGLLGGAIGCLGGLFGVLVGLGRARGFVLFAQNAMLVLGGGVFAAGVFAVVAGQPYAVFYPLLLTGGICLLVFGLSYKPLRRRYEQLELRQMRAKDLAL